MAKWTDIFKKDIFNWNNNKIDEAIEAFKPKSDITLKQELAQQGEGWESFGGQIPGFGQVGLSSFNSFYNKYINKSFETEVQRIMEYRDMARMSEISDIIEDATNESTQEDSEGDLLHLEIVGSELKKNENIIRNINEQFYDLFYEKINTQDVLWNMFRSYYIDGRVFYEKVINKNNKNQGILNIKQLPAETMDYCYDSLTGKISHFYQYLNPASRKPTTIEEAKGRSDVIVFYPDQIGFIDYGVYGKNKHEILGYLEKSRIPYNQLKLLETSVIIYRIVRAPERLVFRIDTGNMPRDKALKYVEKIKSSMTKKQTYNPSTGALTQEPEVLSILENYYMPQSADGRGSQIETVGGQSAGFTELDDIYYFSRKMYRSLKYPLSRVSAGQEKREADIMFGGNNTGEITRDEVKWSRFLETHQKKFCISLVDLFLKHLEFKGLKKQYSLTKKNIKITMNAPSSYREQMEQNFNDSRFGNYSNMADRGEFSLYYLMKKYLKMDDNDIQENVKGRKKDIDLGLRVE